MTKWLSLLIFIFCSTQAMADVTINHAWARATAPGQDVGAAYMELTSKQPVTLISAGSVAANRVEFHEMSMTGGIMKMRGLPDIQLPANTLVKLQPGGKHLMLFGLKQPLKAGDNLNLFFNIKDSQGKITQQSLNLPIKAD